MWVQSKYSKDAPKWEVVPNDNKYQWTVRSGPVPCGYHFLPTSEYILCEPPEEWEDVTHEYRGFRYLPNDIFQANERLVYQNGLHNGPHFLVERKKV